MFSPDRHRHPILLKPLLPTALILVGAAEGVTFQRLPPNSSGRSSASIGSNYTKGLARAFCGVRPGCFRVHLNSPRPRASFQVAPVGRQDVPAYRQEARRVHDAAADLKSPLRMSRTDTRCIWFSEAVSRHDLAAAYRRSRVGLVDANPGRDEPGCERSMWAASGSGGSRRADIVPERPGGRRGTDRKRY